MTKSTQAQGEHESRSSESWAFQAAKKAILTLLSALLPFFIAPTSARALDPKLPEVETS
ncbi:MAG: hypothetical protein JO185_17400 [Acidobacteriaceae bacterium]|nr:hypothetical protein [Acidobacteriaceae bacterium]